MKFLETPIKGAHLIEFEPDADQRGFFARTWSHKDFDARGLNANVAESSLSFNRLRGTLRGLHYQVAPHEETKFIMCVRGAVYDVIVDLRKDSSTYLKWFGAELSIENRQMLYVPAGVAHGFITLQDSSYLHYQISGGYHASAARGVRWNDPAFGIDWPLQPKVIAERDRDYEDFQP